MSTRDLVDFCTLTLGPTALGFGAINPLNPSSSCFNYYLCMEQVLCILKTHKFTPSLPIKSSNGRGNTEGLAGSVLHGCNSSLIAAGILEELEC